MYAILQVLVDDDLEEAVAANASHIIRRDALLPNEVEAPANCDGEVVTARVFLLSVRCGCVGAERHFVVSIATNGRHQKQVLDVLWVPVRVLAGEVAAERVTHQHEIR